MANVRIKDLTTTAATTASDDFFGVDGATNGTRKLDAYSPTFGGNLTVSGGTTTIIGSAPALALKRSSDNSLVGYIDATTTGTLRLYGGVGGSNTLAASFPQTGNVLIGTTSDGGQKLQVAGTGLFSTTESAVTLYATAAGGIAYQLISGGNLGHALGAFKIVDSSTGYVVLNHDKPTSGGTRLSFDGAGNATFAGNVTATGSVSTSKAVVGGSVVLSARNTDNTNSVSAAVAQLTVGGASAGDPRLLFTIDAVQDWSVGVDNSDGDKFKIGPSSSVGTSTSLTLDPTTGNATFAGSIAIGNTVNTVSPTSPNRTITMVIGGTTYYIHAKTTND